MVFRVSFRLLTRQTRATAVEVERRLNADGHRCSVLTGQFDGNVRDSVIDDFRTGGSKVLITTNVLSRGIDVQTVSLVVNYVSRKSSVVDIVARANVNRTCQMTTTAMRIHKLISIVSAVPDVLGASVSPSA